MVLTLGYLKTVNKCLSSRNLLNANNEYSIFRLNKYLIFHLSEKYLNKFKQTKTFFLHPSVLWCNLELNC